MALWLTRRVSLDTSTVDSGSDKRKKDVEADHYLLWLLLIPSSSLPSPEGVGHVLSLLTRGGFEPTEEDGMYNVYPADIAPDDTVYSTLEAVTIQLATVGGAILLRGRGASIAVVCDPKSACRREVVRRAGLDDPVTFAEFAIWMPRPELTGVTHDQAASAILAVLPRVEIALQAACCFAVTTDDLASLATRWPYHRQVSTDGWLSELMWYQSFPPGGTSRIPVSDYWRAGCNVEAREDGGLVAQVGELPRTGLVTLTAARDKWLHSIVPRHVC